MTGVFLVKQYVVYRRISTEEQGKSGLGLEAQNRDIALFLETKNDKLQTPQLHKKSIKTLHYLSY